MGNLRGEGMIVGRNAISQGQIWRCAIWSFGCSILCYAFLTRCAKRNPQWRRRNRNRSNNSCCRLHFACRLWTSTLLGFFTGFFKECLDAIPGVAWPWCGPQKGENPCRFEGRVVLVYYESAVISMIVLIAYTMWRAYVENRLHGDDQWFPPCDETVWSAGVDNFDGDSNWIDNNEAELHDNNSNNNNVSQKPNDDVVNGGGHAGTENSSELSVADDSSVHNLHFHSDESSSCSNSSGETTIVTVVVSVATGVPLCSNDDTTLNSDDSGEDYESSSSAAAVSKAADGDSRLVNAEEGLSPTSTNDSSNSSSNSSSSSNENDSDTSPDMASASTTVHEVGDIDEEDHDSQPPLR